MPDKEDPTITYAPICQLAAKLAKAMDAGQTDAGSLTAVLAPDNPDSGLPRVRVKLSLEIEPLSDDVDEIDLSDTLIDIPSPDIDAYN